MRASTAATIEPSPAPFPPLGAFHLGSPDEAVTHEPPCYGPRPAMPAISGVVRGSGRRIGIVCARFNEEITSRLLSGAQRALAEAGVAQDAILTAHVPGAVEIPLAAAALLAQGKVDAVVALGAVIRGETGHYDSVCRIVEQGVLRVMLDAGQAGRVRRADVRERAAGLRALGRGRRTTRAPRPRWPRSRC